MSISSQTDWIYFLHRLGRAMHQVVSESHLRPCAFLSVPFLDYSSILVASGILAEKYQGGEICSDPSEWGSRLDQPISFPVKMRNGGNELRRWIGVVAGLEERRGEPCLVAKTLDGNGKKHTRFVESRWMSGVRALEELPDLDTKKYGSLLAENIDALDLLLGNAGVGCLLEKASRDCLLVDVKKRVSEESRESIELSRLRVGATNHRLVLRDLLRLDSEGPAAMVETMCCRISSEPEAGWPATVITGSQNFLRSWDDCDSPLRVVILSPSENAYSDAIEEANRIYYQRHMQELVIPPEILAIKPPSLDIQVMFLPL